MPPKKTETTEKKTAPKKPAMAKKAPAKPITKEVKKVVTKAKQTASDDKSVIETLFIFDFPVLTKEDVRFNIVQTTLKAQGGQILREVILPHIVYHKLPLTYINFTEAWPHAIAIGEDMIPLQAFKEFSKLLLWCKKHRVVLDQTSLEKPTIINEVN